MVAGVGTILIDPPEGNLAQYLESLSMLRDLNPRLLMPAHGPVIENAVEYLTEYIDHRHMRTQQIVDHLHAIPGASAGDLAQAIYADLVPVNFLPVAARQIIAHLEWLEQEGQVKVDGNEYHLTRS
jgi:glyoxylase-like metal-dependent hydrolase (beta-lactamase superfamily II)